MSKCRKFNRRLASKIMSGRQQGYIRTADGRPVRIVAWDARGPRPVVGLIYMGDLDVEMSWQWTCRGKSDIRPNVKTPTDLVIEQKDMSSMARCHRAPKKKRK